MRGVEQPQVPPAALTLLKSKLPVRRVTNPIANSVPSANKPLVKASNLPLNFMPQTGPPRRLPALKPAMPSSDEETSPGAEPTRRMLQFDVPPAPAWLLDDTEERATAWTQLSYVCATRARAAEQSSPLRLRALLRSPFVL